MNVVLGIAEIYQPIPPSLLVQSPEGTGPTCPANRVAVNWRTEDVKVNGDSGRLEKAEGSKILLYLRKRDRTVSISWSTAISNCRPPSEIP